jgi:hypothetical protein
LNKGFQTDCSRLKLLAHNRTSLLSYDINGRARF